MNHRNNNFYVITGGPGVGKTTLLNKLKNRGYKTVPENAREIIREQILNNGEGLPWKNKELYTRMMIDASVKSFNVASANQKDIVFFDRGIIDSICYADMSGIRISSEMDSYAQSCLYNKKVFILPPWPEIYETDTERKQTLQEAADTFEAMKVTYSGYGYELTEVPKDTLENRLRFILENVSF